MICGFGKACFLVMSLLICQCSFAQEINWPDFINENNSDADDGPMPYFQSETLTGCTSLSFSVQYNSAEWLTPGNLEYATENPGCGGCLGDPLNPTAGGCNNCWDFLIFDFSVNGSTELNDFIGFDVSDLQTDNLYTWDLICTDPNDVFNIEFDATSQTWTDDEFINLTSFSLICHQAVQELDVTIDPSNQVCEGENVDFSVPSDFDNVEWYQGAVNIGSGNTFPFTGITSGGNFSVEVTDINGCTSSTDFSVTVLPLPQSCVPLPIPACLDGTGTAIIDLTVVDDEVNCNTGVDVEYFENLSDIPNNPIPVFFTYLTDGSDVFAVVNDGTCYSAPQTVMIDVGSGVNPDILTVNVCENEDLNFDVINIPSCGNCDFVWDGPPSSGISGDLVNTPQYTVPASNPSMTGTWTVQVTDDSGCVGSSSVDVTITDSPVGQISGGGDLCPGYCTDPSNELLLNLTGGTTPYNNVTLEISAFVFTTQLTLPAVLPNGSISLCIDPTAVLPDISDYDGDGVDDLVVPTIPGIQFNFSVSLISFEDALGCQGVGSGTISYTVLPEPSADSPPSPFEQCQGTSFDLTTFDSDVNSSLNILWYEDQDLLNPITDPSNYTPGSTPMTVFAVAEDVPCVSQPVSLELIETPQPILDPIGDVNECGSYELPIPSGTDIGTNIIYEEINTGVQLIPTDFVFLSGNYMVTVGDDPNCMATEFFDINIQTLPTITSPIGSLSDCNEITLPTIDVLDLDPIVGQVGYYTGPNQTGSLYNEGEMINDADGITSIFVFVSNGPGCEDEVQIDLNFSNAIQYVLPAYPANGCGDLILEPIGGATAGVAYFTDVDGGGLQYNVGETLEAPGNYTLYVYDPTIDQTCVLNSNESFTIFLEETPTLDIPADVTVCELSGYVLPTITGSFITGDEIYSTDPGAGGDLYGAGETIFTPGPVYISDPLATCPPDEVSFNVTTISGPVIGPIDDVTVCDMYEFEFPIGTDIGSNVVFEDENSNQFLPGDVSSTGGMYELTVGDDPACQVTETFEVTILFEPSILFPTNELSGCGTIILPEIDVQDLDLSDGVVGYYAGSGQSGTSYAEGESIDEASAPPSIFVYAGNAADCFEEIEIDLTFSSSIEYTLPAYPSTSCGALELLPIGGATAGVAYFTEENGGGIQYNVGEVLPAPGSYTLYVYDPTIDQTCVLNSNDSFTITLEEVPTIDPINDVTVCASTGYELPTITGNFLTGDEGYSSATNGSGAVFTAGEIIYTSETVFIYNVVADCPAIEVSFDITVIPTPNAGDGGDYETCIGPTLNLQDYLSLDADGGGVFTSVDGSISLTGSDNNMWNTSDANTNTPYQFMYTVEDPTGVCDNDVSEIFVTLTNDVSSGDALLNNEVCEGETINLFDLLENESSGGYFEDQDTGDQITDGAWTVAGSVTSFNYIIDAVGGCNGAMTSFNVIGIDAQEVTTSLSDATVCEESCIEMTINSNFGTTLDFQLTDIGGGNQVYDVSVAVDGVQTIQLCADGEIGTFDGSTLFLGTNAGNYGIEFPVLQNVSGCETDLSNLDEYNVQLYNISDETIIGEVCEGDGFMYQGQVYFESELITGLTPSGCLATTSIVIQEFPPAENFENDTYCIGTVVPIGGEVYTEATVDQIILVDASANGCDSIINIDISFDNASYNFIEKTLCIGEQEEVEGQIFDVDNDEGEILLANGSVLGCDSIINIMLEFYDEAIGQTSETICQGDTVIILGQEFHAELMQMDIILDNQSEAGCDSIVEVSIDFFPVMEVNEVYEKCEGDTLVIGNFEITDDNLVGFFMMESVGTDCPSIVNYTTNLLTATTTVIDTSICEGETIEIEGITFSEDYTFEESVTQMANGCDSTVTISVTIESASVETMSELIADNEYQLSFLETNINDPIWNSDIGNLSCLTCEEPTILIVEDTEIYFSGISDNGCLVSDTILLTYFPADVDIGIYTPNVFTPDDDNINNIYTIYGSGDFTITEMTIYDRWGNLMYTGRDFLPNEELVGWDGTFNGADAAVGVYVGKIIYVGPDGEEGIESFDLTLLR